MHHIDMSVKTKGDGLLTDLTKALFIVNPTSRGGRGFRQIATQIDSLPHIISENAQHIQKLVASLEADCERLVVIVGGDGSFHDALSGYVKNPRAHNICLVPLPTGSGCDFARYIGAPSNFQSWTNWVDKSSTRNLYLGLASWVEKDQPRQIPFVTAAGFGMPADVIDSINHSKKTFGAKLTYLAESLKSIIQFKSYDLSVEINTTGKPYEAKHAVFICNTPFVGSGMQIAPNASGLNPNLETLNLTGASRLSLIKLLSLCFKGEHIGKAGVEAHTCQNVTVKLPSPFAFELDGEPYYSDGPVYISISDIKLRTLLP
jgi:diacylglycerol kinase family enzyme